MPVDDSLAGSASAAPHSTSPQAASHAWRSDVEDVAEHGRAVFKSASGVRSIVREVTDVAVAELLSRR